MQEVSEMLGHSTVSVTERSYAFLDGQKVAMDAARTIPGTAEDGK
jgi:hypothetical protein